MSIQLSSPKKQRTLLVEGRARGCQAQNLYVSGPSSPSLAVAGYTQDGQPLFIQTSSPQQAVQQVQQVVQSSIVPISQYSPPPAQYSPQPAGGEPREPYGV